MQKYLLIIAFIFTAGMISAQGWERTYPGSGNDEVQAVAQTPDGGFIMAGQRNLFSFYLIKSDADGFLEWNKVYPAVNAYGKSILVTQDSSYVVAGYIGNGISRDAYLVKTNQFGDILWSKTFGGAEADEANKVLELPDGSLVICGVNRATTTANEDILLIKTDRNGNLIWEKTIGQTDKEESGNDLTLAPNGDIVVAGTITDGPDRDVQVLRFDTDGNLIWENTWSFSPGTGGNDQASAIVATADGGLVIAGKTLFVQDGALLFKITGDGDDTPVWIKTYPFSNFRDIESDKGSGFYICGSKTLTLAQGDLFVGHFDFEGDKMWEALAGKAGPDDGFTVVATENGAASAGVSTPFFGSFEVIPYLVRTDANGLIYTSYIRGEIFNDLNGNCEKDIDEPVMEDWIVQAKNPLTEKYAAANSFGEYLFRVDTGVYDLKVIAPNRYWKTCLDVISVSVPDFYDTVSVSIPVQLNFSCPNNEVDVATSLLRRCADNVYTVRYCNNGTTPSLNTKVDVTLDPYMSLTSSSINFSAQNGNVYTFDIGTLNPGDCGNFTVTAFLACVTAGEQSAHCVSAYITPDSICDPAPEWDGAIITAEAKCENDTVKMILKNRGTGNMGERLDYVIIEDVIMLTQPGTLDFQLNANQDTTVFTQPANGKAYRVFAEQSPFFPFQSYPTAAVEGCIPDNNPDPVSLGFYTMFPEDDGAPYASSDCQESFNVDFNPTFLKRGHPKGYDEPHYVSPGTDLDFLIRFRNTGADTLEQVVIRDTLSEWLDPSTVRPGAASHFYDYQLYGNGIVKFTFPNINLAPDSSANEGFVKFRVSQKPELPCGTEILNSAAIYFDFNAPAISNMTFNTVCDSFLLVHTDDVQWLGAEVQVYPNPFSESAFFNVSGVQAQSYTLELYDIQGRLLFNQSYQQPTFRLFRHQIPAGMIFYRLSAEGRPVATGKLVATTQ